MDYPSDFSEQAKARMVATCVKARRDYEARSDHFSSYDATDIWITWDMKFREYLIAVFGAFTKESCELGRRLVWSPVRIESEVRGFMRALVLNAYVELGCSLHGTDLNQFLSNMDGSLLPNTLAMFQSGREWRSFQDDLLSVAEIHAGAVPSNPRPAALDREERLRSFVTNNDSSVAAVGRAAGVYKANMQQWRRGELGDDSVMAKRIEMVLDGRTSLDARGKKKR